MVRGGSKVFRYHNNRQSALGILEYLVSRDPVVLRIQAEMVDQNIDISETSAVRELNSELERERKILQEKMDAALAHLKEANERERERERESLQAQIDAARKAIQGTEAEIIKTQEDNAKVLADMRTSEKAQENLKAQIQGLEQQLKNDAKTKADQIDDLQQRLNEESESSSGIDLHIQRGLTPHFQGTAADSTSSESSQGSCRWGSARRSLQGDTTNDRVPFEYWTSPVSLSIRYCMISPADLFLAESSSRSK